MSRATNTIRMTFPAMTDRETLESFEREVEEFLRNEKADSSGSFELDLSRLRFVNSAVLARLISIKRMVEKRGLTFSLKNVNAEIEQIIRASKLSDFLLSSEFSR